MKNIFLILLVITLFGLSGTLSLHAEEEVRDVIGYGVTKKEATVNALLEAIQQIKGAKLHGVENLHSYVEEAYNSKNGIDDSSASMKSSQHEDIHKEIQGIVKSYEVLDMSPGENGNGWEATLRVQIPVYRTPGISPHSRRKLAIMPFRTVKQSFLVHGNRIPSGEISRQFSQKLVNEITQSRRFTVLDREYICEYFKEKNLLLSGDTPLEEQMRLGSVLGVDYMLVGTITELQLERTSYQIKTLGKTGYKDKATFQADYRIIVMPTRQVKWADSVFLNLSNKKLHQLAGNSDPQSMAQAVLGKGAQLIAHKALANIYPILVASVQPNGHLILNQGGVTVSEGEEFDIFKAGEKVIDPYSGESLGAAETWMGTAKVERVLAKQSYATVIKGDPSSIGVRDICRRVPVKKDSLNSPVKPKKKMNVPW